MADTPRVQDLTTTTYGTCTETTKLSPKADEPGQPNLPVEIREQSPSQMSAANGKSPSSRSPATTTIPHRALVAPFGKPKLPYHSPSHHTILHHQTTFSLANNRSDKPSRPGSASEPTSPPVTLQSQKRKRKKEKKGERKGERKRERKRERKTARYHHDQLSGVPRISQ
jgi:hypothetical protein